MLTLLQSYMEELRQKLDSCLIATKDLITYDAMLNDSLAFSNEMLTRMMQDFCDTIIMGNETEIRSLLHEIESQYHDIAKKLDRKKTINQNLQALNKIVNDYIDQAQNTYLANQKDILQLYVYSSSLSDTVISLYDNSQQQLADLFQLAIEYQKHLLHQNDLQKGFTKLNLQQAVLHRKLAKKVQRYFKKWFTARYQEKEARFNYEKETAKALQSNITDAKRLVSANLKRLELQSKIGHKTKNDYGNN